MKVHSFVIKKDRSEVILKQNVPFSYFPPMYKGIMLKNSGMPLPIESLKGSLKIFVNVSVELIYQNLPLIQGITSPILPSPARIVQDSNEHGPFPALKQQVCKKIGEQEVVIQFLNRKNKAIIHK